MALASLFVHLASQAYASGNTFALVAFGFLLVIFSSSLLVSLFHALRAMRGGGGASDDGSMTAGGGGLAELAVVERAVAEQAVAGVWAVWRSEWQRRCGW